MGSDTMRNTQWKKQAVFLFFVEKKNLVDISQTVGVSRRSVGEYLGGLSGYANEKADRAKNNRVNRKKYQRNWKRLHCSDRYTAVTSETLRREHEVAVTILSHEKHYGE